MLHSNRHSLGFALWLTVALTFIGCNRNTVYSHFESIRFEGWDAGDTLSFTIAHVKDSGHYEGIVGLRTTVDYPFRGLTVVVEQFVSSGRSFFSDTVNAQLVDEDGIVLGKGTSTYQYSFPFRQYHLNKGDSLHVTIHHYMKREILPGIMDVGFTMKRIGSKE